MTILNKILRSFSAWFGRRSPVAVVLLVASVVLLSGVAFRFLHGDVFEPNINWDTQASGEAKRSPLRTKQVPDKAFFVDDPVAHYADRLREASALAIALSITAVHERLANHRIYPKLDGLLAATGQSDLLPPKMEVLNPVGVVSSPRGLYYVRYRVNPFGIEVLAVGSRGFNDGAIFVVRVPDTTLPPSQSELAPTAQAGAYATLFTAPYNAAALIPMPFAPAHTFSAAGWTLEPLRAAPYTQKQMDELQTWLGQRRADSAAP